jgi:hypothetical protein
MTRPGEAESAVRWLTATRAAVTTLLGGSVGAAYLWGSLPFPFAPFLALMGVS